MRIFSDLKEAALELRRELAKSPEVAVTRVQQRDTLEGVTAHERLGMTYSIVGGWPHTAHELVGLGQELGMRFFLENPVEMENWLIAESQARFENMNIEKFGQPPTEHLHPALRSCIEGSYVSYSYQERLMGAVDVLSRTLLASPDTRRAYWPIFHPLDSLRSIQPTRVPCSLGYEVLIRNVGTTPQLMVVYIQRSADFSTFWLSDIWFARKLQEAVYKSLWDNASPECPVPPNLGLGQVYHHIISFHSFITDGVEIY